MRREDEQCEGQRSRQRTWHLQRPKKDQGARREDKEVGGSRVG